METALNNISYGLYVITSNDGKKDNGMIGNSVLQVANPGIIAVSINKQNYSHDFIKKSGKMNVNFLSVKAPFEVFRTYGFQSGRDVDKFAGFNGEKSANGLIILPEYINSYLSLKVEQYIDLNSHCLFICSVEEDRVINKDESMTYSFYHKNVKPKFNSEQKVQNKKKWVCKICGYVYEGDELPADFICPVCKHPASDFELVLD